MLHTTSRPARPASHADSDRDLLHDLQLRDPVDRVLSAYEFAVEVAARVLNRPKDYKPDPSKVNTRDVWPWSQLVPFMEHDMVQRVRTRLRPSCLGVACRHLS